MCRIRLEYTAYNFLCSVQTCPKHGQAWWEHWHCTTGILEARFDSQFGTNCMLCTQLPKMFHIFWVIFPWTSLYVAENPTPDLNVSVVLCPEWSLSMPFPYCTVLYCTVLYCTVLCCAVLYCTVLCCAVLCCAVLCCTVLYCAVLCCAVLCCAVLCCAVLCCAVLCCAVLCCAVLCCAVLYCAVMCCAVLCCTVLYCAVLCCAVLCCAALRMFHSQRFLLVDMLVHSVLNQIRCCVILLARGVPVVEPCLSRIGWCYYGFVQYMYGRYPVLCTGCTSVLLVEGNCPGFPRYHTLNQTHTNLSLCLFYSLHIYSSLSSSLSSYQILFYLLDVINGVDTSR